MIKPSNNRCKNCQTRHKNCHAECEYYQDYIVDRKNIQDARFYESVGNGYLRDKSKKLNKEKRYHTRRKG